MENARRDDQSPAGAHLALLAVDVGGHGALEAAARLVAGPLAGDRSLLQSLRNLHRELAEASGGLDEAEAVMMTFGPERQRYLRLVHRLGRRLLAAQREWLDEVEGELDASRHPGPLGEVD